MSEITNQPLYLIKFDDTEVPDETVFGAEVANKRFEQISGNWNAHLFVKVASNSRDDSCSGSNAKLASDYDALAAQRDEGLAREAEMERENRLLRHDCASFLETMAKTCDLLGIEPESVQNAQGKPSDVLYEHAKDLQQRLAELYRKYDEALAEMQAVIDTGVLTAADYESLEAEICARITDYWKRPIKVGTGCADAQKAPAPAPAVNLPRRKVKTEYSTAEEDAQADAWNAALNAVQELNR